jgi:hypothetical protein
MPELAEDITAIENRLGIRLGFLAALETEDDWSFVIKSHALIESLSAELLTAYFDLPSLIDVFSKLPLSVKETGKVAFLAKAELLTKHELQFIHGLSRLRNELVHNIRNTDFSLISYIAALDPNQRDSFVSHLGWAIHDEHNKISPANRGQFTRTPKSGIWLGVKFLVAIMGIQTRKIQEENQRRQLAANAPDDLDSL